MGGRCFVVMLVLAGCYDQPSVTCKISCTPSDPTSCPDGMQCNAAGLCNVDGATCTGPMLDFLAIGVGSRHVCGLATNGDAYCWGDNAVGELGNGAMGDPKPIPARALAGPFAMLAVGSEHACGLDASGKATCWGQNEYGQARGAGPGTFPTPTPVLAAQAPAFTAIGAGARYTCGLGNGEIWCWGDSQMTNGMQQSQATKVGTVSDWVAMSAGYDAVCGISTSMGVACFGENDRGQLGRVTTTPEIPEPVTGLPTRTPLAVVAGGEMACAIMGDAGATTGELWCWGRNSDETRLIDDSSVDYDTAQRVGTDATWSSIALGNHLGCGIRAGHAWCWGNAYVGGIPNGIWANGTLYVADAVDIGPADQVSLALDAPDGHDSVEVGCARNGAHVSCWGDNAYGQLARGNYSRHGTPIEVPVPAGHTAWKLLDAGHHHNCATTEDDSLYCWGSTYNGAANAGISLGEDAPCVDGEACDLASPTAMPMQVSQAEALVSGDEYSCALLAGSVHCWGLDYRGYLGGSDSTGMTRVTAPANATWTSLSGGDGAACGKTSANTFACWGYVAGMQTDTPAALTPMTTYQSATFAQFGDDFACVVRATQDRACWGDNGNGELGSGIDTSPHTQATPYITGGITTLSARHLHVCAITTSNTVQCWGDNNDLESGAPIINQTQRDPVPIMSASGLLMQCAKTSVSDTFSCAVCGGEVDCWGSDELGYLGRGPSFDGEPTEIAAPVMLPTDQMFVDVSAGSDHACALSAAGRIWCWGDGQHGELGNGAQARNLLTPVAQ